MSKYDRDHKPKLLLGWIRSLDTNFAREETTERAELNFVTELLAELAALWHALET